MPKLNELALTITVSVQPELMRLMEITKEMNELQKEATSLMCKIVDAAKISVKTD